MTKGGEQSASAARTLAFTSHLGKECLQIFLNLKLSEEQRNDVNECMAALEAYFKPKRNVVYERYIFNTCTQIEGETVDGYVNRLRKHASTCCTEQTATYATTTPEVQR